MTCWRDRDEFKTRVVEWAARLGVEAHAIYVRPMRRKWASCSTAGTLSFNDELIRMDKKLGDYVIVHELLHFHVPNHGKLWKMLMRAHLGDYEAIEMALKAQSPRALPPARSDRQGCSRGRCEPQRGGGPPASGASSGMRT